MDSTGHGYSTWRVLCSNNICLRLRDCQSTANDHYKLSTTSAAMFYRQRVKDVKRTGEKNVLLTNYKQHLKQKKKQLYWFTGSTLFMFYWLK